MLETWNGIKSIIYINKKMKKDINCLKVDDQQATNSFVISNYFNKFFTTIAKKIESIIVENRATQDTFESLKVKFFCHFYIPFFSYFWDLKNYTLRLWEVFLGCSIFHYCKLLLNYCMMSYIYYYKKKNWTGKNT